MSGGYIRPANAMIAILLGGAVLVNPLGCAPATPARGAGDPAAIKMVASMLKALGGEDALTRTGALRFTFQVVSRDTVRADRSHWWDRMTGNYRVQGRTQDGQPYVLLFNTQTRDGRAYIAGKELEGAEKTKFMERAYKMFINDTYWFLMPHKLFDPGVHLQMDGNAVVNGKTVDRVKVTFGNVGLTPGDTYWAYIDRGTHIMIRWGMILQDARDEPEQLYDWINWNRYGDLLLSTDRVKVDDPDHAVIQIRNIQVTDHFLPEVFTSPDPMPL